VAAVNLSHPPEQPDSIGDHAQVHRIVRQVVASYREIERPETPPLVKWVVGTVAALGLAATIGGGTWLVSSVGEMQVTLARMDERLAGQADGQGARYDDHERRIRTLEGYHGGK
jgi:hypothetical protein